MITLKTLRALALIPLALSATLATAQGSIVMASTTSTEQSGLFPYLLPEFKKATGIDVKVVAVGTGQAIDMLTTGRRLESFNTGVQSGGYDSPLHRGESVDMSPEDAEALGVDDGDSVRITSRRGSVVAPAHIDEGLRRGVVFMTLHFPDDVLTNVLTIDASDPKSGTAEFKACAVRVEPVERKWATAASRGARQRRQARPPTVAGDD